jgi:acetylornithine deacetylase
MKASVAAMMLAAAELQRRSPAGDLILTLVADEENLSIGTEDVVRRVSADAAIVTEPTALELALAHRGFVWLEVATEGVASHGSRYDLGVDAIARMGDALAGVRELDAGFARAKQHPVLGRASVHASLIEGGQELSTYPDRCVLQVERRTLPWETVEQVEEELRAVAGEASVRSVFSREPLDVSADEPIVGTLLRSAEAVLGAAPEVTGAPFWTDAALLAEAGIPAVLFGPGGDGAHADVEFVELADAERLAEILLATATEFCGG